MLEQLNEACKKVFENGSFEISKSEKNAVTLNILVIRGLNL
jgi:hypothetical protein